MNIFYSRVLRQFCRDFGISYTQPFKDIPKKVQQILMEGTEKRGDGGTGTWFEGVLPNLQRRFDNTESEFVKTRLHQYMSEQPCEVCGGTRLKKEALAVRLHSDTPGPVAAPLPGAEGIKLPGYSIHDVSSLTVETAKRFFENLRLSEEGAAIAEPIVREISSRLGFMVDVGLGYLTLDRKTATLSGGEAQRIRLATQVGSGLVGCVMCSMSRRSGCISAITRG